MMRSALVIFCVICVATLMSETFGLAFLWYRGQLTSDTVKDIRLILSGEDDLSFDADEDAEKTQPSTEDIVRNRTMRVLELDTREEELAILKTMIAEQATSLLAQQELFKSQKGTFEKQLEAHSADITSEATEQSRGILLALPATDSVKSLMELDLEKNVVLLKGMSDKSVAKILQQFFKGDDKQIERGQKILDAISKGEPKKSLVDSTTAKITPGSPVQ